MPDEVVYDQDKVFIVSENSGDIILTNLFKSYIRSKSFTLHFCRRSDPQSKGKIENVVKYVKQNFLYNRTYYNIETMNQPLGKWEHDVLFPELPQAKVGLVNNSFRDFKRQVALGLTLELRPTG